MQKLYGEFLEDKTGTRGDNRDTRKGDKLAMCPFCPAFIFNRDAQFPIPVSHSHQSCSRFSLRQHKIENHRERVKYLTGNILRKGSEKSKEQKSRGQNVKNSFRTRPI